MKLPRLNIFLATFTLVGLLAGVLSNSYPVEAAFGTSPPWVKNDHMLPGTSFEQVINMSRSDTDAAMKATVRITGDKKLLEWITVEDEDNLVLKKGQAILPMKVIVNVPERAELKNYIGGIYISLAPVKTDASLGGGEVAITFGAHIDVNITVVGTKIIDYRIKSITVEPLTEEDPFAVKVEMSNLGNTQISKVEGKIDIYNSQQTEIVKSLDFIPFTDPVSADGTSVRRMVFLDTKLVPGDYWIHVQVIRDGKIDYENRLFQQINEKVIPVITPEDVISKKPALPGDSKDSSTTTSTTTSSTTTSTTTDTTSSDLKPAAPVVVQSNSGYIIFGLAGLGLGFIALIGIIVVLIIVLKNQQRALTNQFPAQMQFPAPTVCPPPVQFPAPTQRPEEVKEVKTENIEDKK